jgi:DNA recombination protein Rad52
MTFTPEQTALLTAPLNKANVASREQGGKRLSYIEAWHAIAEANRIFGFGAWDRQTVELRQLGEPRVTQDKYGKDQIRVGYSARVRITVRAGDAEIIREGCGFGSGIDKDVDQAHESALKEAESDAMKRALMTFGNAFGLALYDKTQANVADAPPPEHPMLPEGRIAASMGTTALGAWWNSLSVADKNALANAKDAELKPMAAVADAAARTDNVPHSATPFDKAA